MRRLSVSLLAACCAAAALAGCAGDEEPDAASPPTSESESSAPEPATPEPATPEPATPEPATPATSVAAPLEPIAGRCSDQLPRGAQVGSATLKTKNGDVLRAGDFATSSQRPVTALVLLHQTDGIALCGWGEFATQAARKGYPSVAIDLCGYGDSECSDELEADPAAQVDLAVTHAEKGFNVDRVVVVGASMGGSNAVVAAVDRARVDAWVDVSGPNAWFIDRPLAGLAPALRKRAPGMIVFARTDGASAYAGAQRLADRSGAEFVDGGSGHGWDLLTDDRGRLTPVGRTVLAFSGQG